MGSRKRKGKVFSEKQQFIAFYKSLTIHEKVAMKQCFYCLGRQRITLSDLLTYPYFWQLGELILRDYATAGLTWKKAF